ncbi:MAG: hypothetical protein H6739_36670 [Alphaproteobacteria bacterium]|nr:hypothetical protein [Alphaproteobacteria bacterium]
MIATLLVLACVPKEPVPIEVGLGGAPVEASDGVEAPDPGPPRGGLPPLAQPLPELTGIPEPSAPAIHRIFTMHADACLGDALGRDPSTRGAVGVLATYDTSGRLLSAEVSGTEDDKLIKCLESGARRVMVRAAEEGATARWSLHVDPDWVSPSALIRGNGYSVGYTKPTPEFPAFLTALGYPTPIDGDPAHDALRGTLEMSRSPDCAGLLPAMAPRPLGLVELDVGNGRVLRGSFVSADVKGEAVLSCVEASIAGLAVPATDQRYTWVVEL